MDTTTVLEIIRMIDERMYVLEEDDVMHQEEFYGAMTELKALSTHLQDCIEDQLNAAENSTPE
jgi:hypothetical protein